MEYKDTIFLPKSSFEMRANLPTKEPKILEEWDKEKILMRGHLKKFLKLLGVIGLCKVKLSKEIRRLDSLIFQQQI